MATALPIPELAPVTSAFWPISDIAVMSCRRTIVVSLMSIFPSAAQASTACRSFGVGAPEKAITASPMNLSIVPLGADIAEEVSSRYSLTTGTIDVAELLREPGETDNVGE